MDTWHKRLEKALEARGVKPVELARATGNKPPSVSDWLSGKTRMMGGQNALKTCDFLRISQEWLFTGRGPSGLDDEVSVNEPLAQYSNGRRADDDSLHVPQYREVMGAMGRGVLLKDQPGQIVGLRVTKEWLNKNVPSNTGHENLCVVTGFGDSMKGMYNPGDPLLVDAGVKSCDHDGVYFFRIDNEGFIKRLQRIPGVGIKVISENKAYETWTITKDMDFEVFAKVLKVWESTDF